MRRTSLLQELVISLPSKNGDLTPSIHDAYKVQQQYTPVWQFLVALVRNQAPPPSLLPRKGFLDLQTRFSCIGCIPLRLKHAASAKTCRFG